VIKRFQPIFECFLFLSIVGCVAFPKSTVSHDLYPQVCFDSRCFHIELARTPEEHMRGLQFRKFLGSREGMLFIFLKSDFHFFWMKNTQIPLDMIWMDSDQRVIFIESNASPCRQDPCPSFGPQEKSRYVLEVPSGTVDSTGIQVGKQADFRFNNPQKNP